MPAHGLIDTSAMLALLHEDDRWHAQCRETFRRFRVPWATSLAVLTEFFYLASRGPHSVATAWDFVRSGTIALLPIEDADLPALDDLMRKYADRPMDLADATLVHLARREALSLVFTVDHNDFETYRIEGRRRFRIVPER
jgi:predicted nucleic acid-binding protein